MSPIASNVLTQARPPLAVTALEAPLNFIRRQDTKPVFHSAALTSGQMNFFFDPEAHTVPISDIREIAETLSVDREGFELLRHTTAVENLYDDDAVKQVYYRRSRHSCVVGSALARSSFSTSRAVPTTGPGRRIRTDGAVRQAGSTSTIRSRADRSARRVSSARRKWSASPHLAPGLSRSISGGRSAGPWSDRRLRSPMRPPWRRMT